MHKYPDNDDGDNAEEVEEDTGLGDDKDQVDEDQGGGPHLTEPCLVLGRRRRRCPYDQTAQVLRKLAPWFNSPAYTTLIFE